MQLDHRLYPIKNNGHWYKIASKNLFQMMIIIIINSIQHTGYLNLNLKLVSSNKEA